MLTKQNLTEKRFLSRTCALCPFLTHRSGEQAQLGLQWESEVTKSNVWLWLLLAEQYRCSGLTVCVAAGWYCNMNSFSSKASRWRNTQTCRQAGVQEQTHCCNGPAAVGYQTSSGRQDCLPVPMEGSLWMQVGSPGGGADHSLARRIRAVRAKWAWWKFCWH